MKRRTSSALPVFYSQVRQVATAAKPNPRLWDPELTVTPPAPNLSKWAKPARLPQPPTPSSSSLSPNTAPTPRGNQWGQRTAPILSPNALGKWARREAPHSPLNSRFTQRGNPALAGTSASSPMVRWSRQDVPHQRHPPSQASVANHKSRLDRDEAPHVAGDLSQYSRRSDRRSRWDSVTNTSKNERMPSFQDPRAQPRPDTKASRTSTVEGEAEDEDVSDLYTDYTPPEANQDSERVRRLGRDKANYKTRGSIASHFRGEEVAIPGHSRMANAAKAKLSAGKEKERRRQKTKALKRVNADVFIPSTVSVGQLARLLNVRMEKLQRKMVVSGMEEESAYDHILTSEYAALLAGEFHRNPVINDEAAFDIYPRRPHPDPSTLPLRPPIVTIMGHVDHGKTTLLDTLRSASVAKGEAGGITQHIGAFSVPVPIPESNGTSEQPRTITFLDTPGHAAFSAMRARGAGVTDIIVLVVAADDGVMPQTKEVIELTKKDEGKVGVVVAINKVDKPAANVENVTHALMAESIQLESHGGDTPGVEVSGLTGQGLDNLVETLSAMAEMQDLRAERDGQVHGYVLESNVRKGLGPVATILILRGCLTPSSHLIAGMCHGKVRIMNDSAGTPVREAYPGMAVIVSGWKELPNAGDEVLSGSEADVKKALANRQRKAEVEATLVDMEAINTQRIEERRKEDGVEGEEEVQEVTTGPKELRLVIKGDVSGSVEALEGALQGIGNKDAVVKIVSTGVGDVSESDVMMAKVAEGMIVAFSVNIPRAVESTAASSDVPLYSSTIIYRVMEEVRNRVAALLPTIIETKVTGEANVQALFNINLKGKQTKQVAGCRVFNGLVEKSRNARVIRDGVTMHEGPLDSLKQGKKDMTEIRKGMECGLSFANFEDLQQDDLIQMYQEIERPGVL